MQAVPANGSRSRRIGVLLLGVLSFLFYFVRAPLSVVSQLSCESRGDPVAVDRENLQVPTAAESRVTAPEEARAAPDCGCGHCDHHGGGWWSSLAYFHGSYLGLAHDAAMRVALAGDAPPSAALSETRPPTMPVVRGKRKRAVSSAMSARASGPGSRTCLSRRPGQVIEKKGSLPGPFRVPPGPCRVSSSSKVLGTLSLEFGSGSGGGGGGGGGGGAATGDGGDRAWQGLVNGARTARGRSPAEGATLDELLALPSDPEKVIREESPGEVPYDASPLPPDEALGLGSSGSGQDVAVVLLVHSRPEMLARQIDAILASTAAAPAASAESSGSARTDASEEAGSGEDGRRAMLSAEVSSVTVLCFASPREPEMRAAFDAAQRARDAWPWPLRFVSAPIDLRYSGMYQLTLLEGAEFVAFLDDDFVPGPEYLAACRHVMGLSGIDGPLGAAGWVFPVETRGGHGAQSEDAWGLPPYRTGNILGPWVRPQGLTRSDTVGGIVFMRSAWIKLYFRERLVEWRTGADMVISFVLPHHAGLVNRVMPAPESRKTAWGFSRDFRTGTLQDRGATNDDTMVERRQQILHHLWRRGYPLVLAEPHYAALRSVFFFAGTATGAAAVSAAVAAVAALESRPRVLFGDAGRWPEDEMRAGFGPKARRLHTFDTSYFSAMVEYDLPGRVLRAGDLLAEVTTAYTNIFEITQPRVLIVPASADPAVTGASLAASYQGIPVVAVTHGEVPPPNTLREILA